jgi:hypothetical protein
MLRPGKLQAVVLIPVLAILTGCAATKEYTSKLFKPAEVPATDSQQVVLRFLDLEKLDGDQRDWVSTDLIRGVDTLNTDVLDGLAEVKPARPDSSLLEKKSVINQESSRPVAGKMGPGEVRQKRVRE